MLRRVLLLFGVLEVLFPDRIIAASEAIALENPDECELRPWTVAIARLEGIAFLLLVIAGKRPRDRFAGGLGVLGLPALLFPRRYLYHASRLAYRDADRCEWKRWVVPFTRLLGLLYVLVALDRARRRR